jgi:serine/threonine protein kinase
MSSTFPDGADSLRLAHEVDALCDRYEKALLSGTAGRLEDWLPVGESERAAALIELVLLDFEHRLQSGEAVQPDEYFTRFPELRADTAAVGRLMAAAEPRRHTSETTYKDGPESRFGPTPQVGTCIGDFELMSLLGAGAFGQVFLARQVSLSRQVAVKITANQGDEARTLARLEHAHIVQVFAETVDAARDLRLLCMQYIPGTTLQRVIDELRVRPRAQWSGRAILDVIDAVSTASAAFDAAAMRGRELLADCDFVEAACWYGARLAEALAHAHSLGVLHRDVKPANILLSCYGRPYLADFNVASVKRRKGDTGSTMGGTLAYMAPEHLEACVLRCDDSSGTVDERADVYSLGVVLFEMLSGRLPFDQPASPVGTLSDRARAMIAQRRVGPPPLPTEIAQPTTVARLVRRCMEPDPLARYQQASELARSLDGCREMRRIERDLPPAGSLERLLFRWPFLLGWALIVAPQVLASVVNISYNVSRIGLTNEQQRSFWHLVLVYNCIAYPLCLFLSVAVILPIRRMWQRLGDGEVLGSEAVAAARRQALRLPFWTIIISSLGWLPGGLIFPLGLQLMTRDPVGLDVFCHFLVSFTLSWLIAVTYSFLAAQFLVLRILYPSFWAEASDMRAAARTELAGLERRLGLFQFLAVLIPLVGAILMISVNGETFEGQDYATFRLLVTALIALGMFGLGAAILATSRLRRTLSTLIGERH